jgi:hypothetical protein
LNCRASAWCCAKMPATHLEILEGRCGTGAAQSES